VSGDGARNGCAPEAAACRRMLLARGAIARVQTLMKKWTNDYEGLSLFQNTVFLFGLPVSRRLLELADS
jgi:hypothetical protein